LEGVRLAYGGRRTPRRWKLAGEASVGEEELRTGAYACRRWRLGRGWEERGLRAQRGGGELLVAEACAASRRHQRRQEASVIGGGRRQLSQNTGRLRSQKGGGESRVETPG